MPGQQAIAPQPDGTFHVVCKLCRPADGGPQSTVATGIQTHANAESVARQHAAKQHRFREVVTVAGI